MIWDQLTSEKLAQCQRNIPVLLPLAATEQHGAHLPLATDRLIGEHFAGQLHQSIPQQVLVLPAISVGCSDHHMDFCGSLTLSHEVFIQQVKEIILSVIHHGFDRIVLLNSHGGNQAVGQVIIEQLGRDHPECHFVMATWWRIVTQALMEVTETGFGGVGHAGEFETSLMMLIAPDLVDTANIRKGDNQPNFNWADGDMLRSPQASYYRTMQQMTPNGVFGDPRAASVEKGQRITQLVVDRLKEIVGDLSTASK